MANSALWPSGSSSPPRRTVQSSNVKVTRGDWLDVALSAVAIEGVDHVTVLALSERLGVSRSSFYWYFTLLDQSDHVQPATRLCRARVGAPLRSRAKGARPLRSCQDGCDESSVRALRL
jgi:hypothetical protein